MDQISWLVVKPEITFEKQRDFRLYRAGVLCIVKTGYKKGQMVEGTMTVSGVGALLFGIVIGWITNRTLRRSKDSVALGDIATVIGAVGGAAVTGLFKSEDMFAFYCIGLFVGFFAYLILSVTILKDVPWLGNE